MYYKISTNKTKCINIIIKGLYILGVLFTMFIINTSCSRKALPETSHHKQASTKAINKKAIVKEKYSNKTIVKKSNTTTITTNNRELKQFLSQGYGKKLSVGKLTADNLIKSARKYMGVPHRMGGSSTKGMDCSGLVMRAFANNGVQLPHNSEEQARYGDIIQNKSQLHKGDLVFFINTYNTSKYITHAGIFIGNNQFIHTSSSRGVTITSLNNSWWKDKFIFGTRIF